MQRSCRLEAGQLIVAGLLSLVAVALETAFFGMLIPLVQTLVEGKLQSNQNVVLGPYSLSATHLLYLLLIGILTTIGLKNIFQFLSQCYSSHKIERWTDQLRQRSFEKLLSLPHRCFEKLTKARLQQLLTQYPNDVGERLFKIHHQFFNLALLLGYGIFLFILSWQLTLLLVTVLPLVLTLSKRVARQTEKYSRNKNDSHARFNSKILEALNNRILIYTSNTQHQESEKFSKLSKNVAHSNHLLRTKEVTLAPLQEIVGIFSLMVLSGLYLTFVGNHTASSLAQLLIYFLVFKRALYCLSAVAEIYTSFQVLAVPLQEIANLLSMPEQKHSRSCIELNQLHLGIEIRHGYFGYRKNDETLTDICLEIPKNKITALTGPNGVGKSTLIKILLGIYELDRGQIFVDGIPIQELSKINLVDKMSYVGPESHIVSGSLKENLTYGLDETPAEWKLYEALQKAQLTHFIKTLPNGLNTLIGRRGHIGLSSGEIQKVAIARAFLKESPIVIFDEATSHLDEASAKQVQKAIQSLVIGKTTLLIAHQQSTLALADRIAYLKDGKIQSIVEPTAIKPSLLAEPT